VIGEEGLKGHLPSILSELDAMGNSKRAVLYGLTHRRLAGKDQIMNRYGKITSFALLANTLAFGAVSAAQAQDTIKKNDAMKTDTMKKDAMHGDAMKGGKDAMKRDSMKGSSDSMSKGK
jgi:pentapeptide MXKDX repeat protein